jgi:leucyl/phenylalanyl-tRNA--protein transferase
MPVFQLDERIAFPPPELADESGLLAVGGDLCPERLLLAYALGIFPWFNEGMEILWHSPDPRMVLPVERVRVGRSLRKTLKRGTYRITLDTAFAEVVAACATVPRDGQAGTWITRDMKTAYTELHQRGFAHSAEAWHEDQLVGGLYGVSLGSMFFGESMFAMRDDAAKVAFVTLAEQLARWGFDLIDCQVYTEHVARFGATMWPRASFLAALHRALGRPTRRGPWRLDERSEPHRGGEGLG